MKSRTRSPREIKPAWADDANYPPFPGNSSLIAFAWEFLRRNRRYRASWLRYQRAVWRAQSLPEFASLKRGAFFTPQHYDPPRTNAETIEQWRARVGPDGTVTELSEWFARPWELKGMCDPELRAGRAAAQFAYVPVGEMTADFPLRQELQGWLGAEKNLHPTRCALWVDLEMPLEKLHAHVIGALKKAIAWRVLRGALRAPEQTKKRMRVSPMKLRRYLQAIDATDMGVQAREIARAIAEAGQNDTRTVRNWIRNGERLRDREWRTLLTLNDPVSDPIEAKTGQAWLDGAVRSRKKAK